MRLGEGCVFRVGDRRVCRVEGAEMHKEWGGRVHRSTLVDVVYWFEEKIEIQAIRRGNWE